MKTILLIMIGLSSLSVAQESPRFTKENGVVTDSKTTLKWQDDYSDNGDSIKSAKWTDAIDYCEGLSLNGQSDWRLPNKKELLSIVDYDRYNPNISPVFQKTTSNVYWSSTTSLIVTNSAYLVNFSYGGVGSYRKSQSFYVRCVRAGQ